MGTSTSSSGPASGISMDPPWLDDVNIGTPQATSSDTEQEATTPLPVPVVLAPRARFGMARRNLNEFARTGSRESFKKAVGHYSKKGMGGAGNVAKRMKASTNAVTGLVSFLRDVQSDNIPQLQEWVQTLMAQEPNAHELADAIIDRVSNEGGMIDEESIKDSMANAMSELFEQNPDIDLLNLNDNETWSLVENFLSYEASHRLQLDIGQLLEGANLTPKEMVERTEEMYDYLKSEISAQLQPYMSSDMHPEISKLDAVIQQALESTFLVFEGAIE